MSMHISYKKRLKVRFSYSDRIFKKHWLWILRNSEKLVEQCWRESSCTHTPLQTSTDLTPGHVCVTFSPIHAFHAHPILPPCLPHAALTFLNPSTRGRSGLLNPQQRRGRETRRGRKTSRRSNVIPARSMFLWPPKPPSQLLLLVGGTMHMLMIVKIDIME